MAPRDEWRERESKESVMSLHLEDDDDDDDDYIRTYQKDEMTNPGGRTKLYFHLNWPITFNLQMIRIYK